MLKSLALLMILFIFSAGGEHTPFHLAHKRGEQRISQTSFLWVVAEPDPGKYQPQIETPKWYATPEGWLCILGVPTLIFVGWQAKATADAARATEESVIQARTTAKLQMRAYLVVQIGGAVYQEREKGTRFGALPQLVNTGQTPAHDVRLQAKAGVFPIPLPNDAILSEVGDELGETVVGIQQTMTMHARAIDFCHDDDVESIKNGDRDRALYTWGIVHYKDVFGDTHHTRFCHQLKWLPGGEIYGYYTPGRNEAT